MNIDIIFSEKFGAYLLLDKHYKKLDPKDECDYISYNPDNGHLSLLKDKENITFNIALSENMHSDFMKIQRVVIAYENTDKNGTTKIKRHAKLLLVPRHKRGKEKMVTPDVPKNMDEFFESCYFAQPLHRSRQKKILERDDPLPALNNLTIELLNKKKERKESPSIESGYSPSVSYNDIIEQHTSNETIFSKVSTTEKRKNKKSKAETPTIFFSKFTIAEDLKNISKENRIKDVFNTNVHALIAPISSYIGLTPLKEKMNAIISMAQANRLRSINDMKDTPVSLHMIFRGSPGTGKTSAAREIAKIMKELDYLENGNFTETTPDELRRNDAHDIISKAIGGVLFIDEAYSFFEKEWGTYSPIIPILLKIMEDNKNNMIVILAGYTNEINNLVQTNPGIASRFPIQIDFPDYTPNEMVQIYQKFCTDHGYKIEKNALEIVESLLSNSQDFNDPHAFGNARGVRNLFEKTIFHQSLRIISNKLSAPDDITLITEEDVLQEGKIKTNLTPTNIEKLLAPLNALLGLENIKTDIKDLIHLINAQQMRQTAKLPTTDIVLHSLFMGPPGTGKTSVARLLGNILKEIGVLKKGHVVEVDREKLTGRWIGWSAKIAAEKFKEAEGGILFIDEAYNLTESDRSNAGSFAEESLNTILKLMEDNRNKVMVICAGYEKEMKKFLKSNSGLESRFPRHLTFKNYDADTMVEIFKKLCAEKEYQPTSEALKKLRSHLAQMDEEEINKAGNGRLVRNIFEKTIVAQSKRITLGILEENDLNILTKEDISFPIITETEGKIGFLH